MTAKDIDEATSADADAAIRRAAKGHFDDNLAAKDFDAAIRRAAGHAAPEKDDDE
jgi:hypothetical protein